MQKTMKEGTVEEALDCLSEKIPSFLEHVFIKRKQSAFFEDSIANLNENEAVVQVDFSENYACQHQDEIQSAHWCQEQVTLFTVAIWAKDSANTDTTCNSHVIVTDDHNHDKQSIAVFMDYTINTLVKEMFPQVASVDIFSDGPSSQFKNRYMANFYQTLQQNGVKINWHFFASSHGKGVVDGLGGTVRRVVWTAVSSRQVPRVGNAEESAKVANALCTAISTHLFLKADIIKASIILGLDNCFLEAKPIPGIAKIHCLEPSEGPSLHCHLYSSQPSPHKVIHLHGNQDISWGESSGDESGGSVATYESSEDSDTEIVTWRYVKWIKDSDSTHDSNDDTLSQGSGVNSEHWFLGVVLPKEKTIVIIDSLPQNFIKPTATTQVDKMFFLKEVDKSITIDQWSFYTNKPWEIPQQLNSFDCEAIIHFKSEYSKAKLSSESQEARAERLSRRYHARKLK
ncbi:predicted protein [Nematostella vectensis]|uniref:Ubiquitin-like protease family profile domain-containing protein n=1 Tax=Nematostella vectensis TaxID=45351 RepID=A7T377_NEMVE|nr:predicted protein [Nematostella vectensis]|eukprot:XP_001621685.1 hypothetical protein NEMVEDRAFT_v1g221694 [Nematostella vectensis]